MSHKSAGSSEGSQMLSDLDGIQRFLERQKQLISDAATFDKMVDNQVKVWMNRLRSCKITAIEATQLSEALANGPWKKDQLDTFGKVLCEQMEEHVELKGNKGNKRPSQVVKAFAAYFTANDMELMADSKKHNNTKLELLADKCVNLGLHLPTEKVATHIVKSAVDCSLDEVYHSLHACMVSVILDTCWPLVHCLHMLSLHHELTLAICQTLSGGMKSEDSATFYKLVREFKDMLRSKIKHLEKVPLMQTFPDSPFDLPKEVFDRVFPPDNQPVQECTASLGMSAGLPSRKSHGSVKGKRKQSFPETMSTAMEEAPNMMMQMMSMFQMMMMQQQGMSADSLGLEVFANKRPKKAPKAIMDKPAEEPGDNDAAEGPRASTSSPPTTTPRQSAPQKTPESAQSTPPAPAKQLFATSPEGTKSPEDYVANLQAALKSREKSKAQQKKDNRQDDEEEEPVRKKPAAKAKSIAKKTEEEKESKEVDSASVKKTAAKAKAAAKSAPKASAGKAKPKAAVKSAAAEPPREGASELPNPPVPWNGTFFWLEGKVHRNPAATCWRVFINKSDRNDKKVKFGDDEIASFHKALRLIEDGIALRKRAEVAENVD